MFFKTATGFNAYVFCSFLPPFWMTDEDMTGPGFQRPDSLSPHRRKRQASLWSHTSKFTGFAIEGNLGLCTQRIKSSAVH